MLSLRQQESLKEGLSSGPHPRPFSQRRKRKLLNFTKQ
jgi:hypothetical protein